MEKHDAERFGELITALAAAFGREADQATQLGYWLGLKDLPLDAVEHAIMQAMRECEHMPRPVELRRGAGHIGTPERAVIAFGAVSKAIRAHGHRPSIDFDDKLINAAVRNLGGWGHVCALPSEEFEKWWRKDFERVYSALCQAGASADACRALPGLDESENSSAWSRRLSDGSTKEITTVRVAVELPEHRPGLIRGEASLRLVSGDE